MFIALLRNEDNILLGEPMANFLCTHIYDSPHLYVATFPSVGFACVLVSW